MHAWQVSNWCEPDQMDWVTIDLPEPVGNEVKIDIASAALNFLDTLMIKGEYQVKPQLPFTPGVEIAGTVISAGPDSKFASGDRVCGLIDHGGFGEQVVTRDNDLIPLPDNIDFVTGSVMPVVYPTAWCALKLRANLQPGEIVLVHAAAGGVGLAALQLARHWGARVFATAGSAEKRQLCLQYGAEAAFDYSDEWRKEIKKLTNGHGVDVVVDNVGGDVCNESVRALAWGGRLTIVGFAGGEVAHIPANRLLLKNASAMGVMWGGYAGNQPEFVQPALDGLFGLLSEGDIEPVIGKRYSLKQAPQALKDLADRKTHGKVVLIP
ncbi:MAG: NADPH:quinone oxidoreductase family protein [Immundisolibacteraceae bacterium]|nr:NADPH:quinone oxidoreductase family protein [Immundisolibacteraceae bacterium]